MAAREEILAKIKAGKPRLEPLPDVPSFPWPGDRKQNFIRMLKSFDGEAMEFGSRQKTIQWLQDNMLKEGKVICSSVKEYPGTVRPVHYADDLHKASEIDICVGEGLFGVGEMGAILISDDSLGKVPCALFSTDLYLLLNEDEIVEDMHQAYDRFNLGDHAYSSFFTGPSATADIEAFHITGAQAQISLTALLYKPETSDKPKTSDISETSDISNN